MLKSSNFESLNDDAFTTAQLIVVNNNNNEVRPQNATEINKNFDLQLPAVNSNLNSMLFKESNIDSIEVASQSQQLQNSTLKQQQALQSTSQQELAPTLASVQLAAGVLRIFEPPLTKARVQLKELIGKQNKILIDLTAEKFKWDNADMAKLHEMMLNVKVYKEKLTKIKKQMQNIYQRTQSLKKRAAYIQICKQKELQRKLQKQQQEESLIKHKSPTPPSSNTN